MGLAPENILGRYLLLFSIALFLILTIPSLFSDGMFLDGLMYAAVAKNLSLGQGTIWNLEFTETFYTQFNEHPPLVFWLQSLLFKLLGNHLWVERCYSLGTYVIVSFLMYRVWRFLGKDLKSFWLPMLFFALIPLTTWSTANNMLENTMSIFTCASVYFYLLSTRKAKYYYLLLSGLMIVFAFLCKGFTGLYVLVFPLIYELFEGNRDVLKGVLDSALLLLLSVLIVALLFYFNEDALEAILRYYERQVVGSLENVITVKSRFYILTKLLTELLIPLGVMLLIFIWSKKAKVAFSSGSDRLSACIFFIVGLCGVVPIIVSLKQSGFYIVTTFPFFSISLSLFVYDGLRLFQKGVLLRVLKWVKRLTISLVLACLVLFIVSIGRSGRDKEKLRMIAHFGSQIQDDQRLCISNDMWSDWNVHAYFSRLKNVSLSAEKPEIGELYLSKSIQGDDFELTLSSSPYFLYRKMPVK